MNIEVKYPHVLAAVKKHENSLWAIGDALLEDVGGGSLAACAAELKVNGFDYKEGSLREIRSIAKKFPSEVRNLKIPFSTHKHAGTPRILNAAIAAAEAKGVVCSQRFVDAYVASLESDEHREQRRKHELAKQRQEDAEAEQEAARKQRQKALNEAARKRAERAEQEAAKKAAAARQRVKETKPAPEKTEVREVKNDPISVIKLEFDAQLSQLIGITRSMKRDIRPHVDGLPKVWVEATVEQLLEAAENIRKLADLIRKNQPNERGHLTVVA